MPDWVILVLGLVLLALLFALSAGDFLRHLLTFLAPDKSDARKIERQFGENTPEAHCRTAKRFGPGAYLKDAATGLCGLAGMALLFWLWFG